ncbi:aminotransferase class V-fold PLP-dependent enzyme [Cellulosilyticum ruminicola]|uniref:aminotransferase class V-fold PLP-dependent enzyme n=1 Tax=Cellulosilyticum ruminicola TaxID=425254 RepID=UPI0006D05407|nr:aminotransferase class V-fold PLP-dependent enzyme [Cellulosilyticum ruminicola]
MAQKIIYRELFNGIEVPIELADGRQVIPINFDNGATTPPLKEVDKFIAENILMYGSVGRGGHKSEYCTKAYELSKEEILSFFGVSQLDKYEVIYVKNTTEGINLLAGTLCDRNNYKILTSRMEHHANDLPWRNVGDVFYIDVNKQGKINLEQLEYMLERAIGTIKYVSITAASNVTGYITDIHQIAKIAHKYGAKLIVDGAQVVAHRVVCLKGQTEEEDIDGLVFSGHKMYAPFGSGVVIIKKELLQGKKPFLQGGGSVKAVFDYDVYYKDSWEAEEAGSPNFLGCMAIVAAMTVLKSIGLDKVADHEDALRRRLIKGLRDIKQIKLYGDPKEENRVGVVTFNAEGIYNKEVGRLLQEIRGIAVRTGCFCAQPYVMRLMGISEEERYYYLKHSELQHPGMIRASFGLYNTEEEVDEFLDTLEFIISHYN